MMLSQQQLDAILDMLREVYKRSPTGCCLHIMTDDGNVEDKDAAFIMTEAARREHDTCLRAAATLAELTEQQRLFLYQHHYYDFCNVNKEE